MEWQPIETAPYGRSGDNSSCFIGMRVDMNGRMNTATCYRNEHGAYEWWGGGISPSHWMPLPPAPTGGPRDESSAKLAQAVDALRPFAEQADTFDSDGAEFVPDEFEPAIVGHTIGDLRRARATLAALDA